MSLEPTENIDCYEVKEEPRHCPPYARKDVETAVTQIATGHTVYEVSPDKTAEEKKGGAKLIRACEITAEFSDEYNGGSCDEDVARFLAKNGVGIKKFTRIKGADWGYAWLPVEPLAFFPDPAGRFVLEAFESYVGEIKEEISNANQGKPDDKKPFNDRWFDLQDFTDDLQKVTWGELWTPTTRKYFMINPSHKSARPLSGEQKNLFGELPYKWRASGKGRGRGAPEERFISVLAGKETLYEAMARAYTALDYFLRYHVYQEMWYLDTESQYFTEGRKPGQFRPVSAEVLDNGAMLAPQPTVNPDLYQFINITDNHLNMFGGSPALRGRGAVDESGRKMEDRVVMAAAEYQPQRKALADINSDCASMLARVLKNDKYNKDGADLDGKTKIYMSDIPDNVRVKVTLEPKDPAQDRIIIEDGLRLLERGVIPIRMFLEDYLKKPNGVEILAEILAERTMLENELMRNAMVAEALEQQGMDEQAEMLRLALAQSGTNWQNAGSKTQTLQNRALPQPSGPAGAQMMNPEEMQVPGGR